MRYRIVQPWGSDKARQATIVSEHPTATDVFAEVDRIAAATHRNGSGGDYLELLVTDAAGNIVRRPHAN